MSVSPLATTCTLLAEDPEIFCAGFLTRVAGLSLNASCINERLERGINFQDALIQLFMGSSESSLNSGILHRDCFSPGRIPARWREPRDHQ